MKFIVSRTKVPLWSKEKPCEEAVEEMLTPLDYRMVPSIEEAKKKIWFKEWWEGGVNHREEGGMIVCEKKQKEKNWVIEIKDLEDLIKFQEKYGEIMILDSPPYKEVKKEIRILRAK
ncbi:MAG: hypothetical protein ACK4GJ_02270 [bacterium]